MDTFDELVISGEDRKDVEAWSLVLTSAGIDHKVIPVPDGWSVFVSRYDLDRAADNILLYEQENKGVKPSGGSTYLYRPIHSGWGIALLLIGFFIITGPGSSTSLWGRAGGADAERIIGGEWWRLITALTLHADWLHIVSNALCVWIFCTAVCHALGPGLGWIMILASGIFGNLLTAAVHQSNHFSIGASTAIFGAAGILAALEFVKRKRCNAQRKKAWIPIAAVIAILAMLGAGKNSDIVAHLSGALCGFILGAVTEKKISHPLSPRIQSILCVLSVLVIIASWGFAFA